MQIRTSQTKFEAFEGIFKLFERDSNHSNTNLNRSNTSKAFEFKFKPLKGDSNHLNVNSNHSKGIRSIQKQIWTIQTRSEPFDRKFEPIERDLNWNSSSNHSNEIRTIWMQIWTIEKGNLMQIRTIPNEFKPFETKFEAFECKFEPLKGILTIQCKFEPIKRD